MDRIRNFFSDIKDKLASLIGKVRGGIPERAGARGAYARRGRIAARARTGGITPERAAREASSVEFARDHSPGKIPDDAQQAASQGRSKPEAVNGQPGSAEGLQGYSVDAGARTRRPFYTARGAADHTAQTGVRQADAEEPKSNADATGEAKHQAETPDQSYGLDRFYTRWIKRVTSGVKVAAAQPEDDAAPQGIRQTGFFKRRTKPPNAVLGVAFTTLKLTVFAVLVLGVAGAGAVVGIAKAYVDTTPVLDMGKIQNQDLTSFIYDGNGNLITTFAGMENRVWAPIDEIPQQMRDAIVAIEDARFYTHNGVDVKRIVGAFLGNMSSDSSQGGSTITQQLIKNTMVTSERTYKRKIQEAWLAMQLESQYSKEYAKDQILEDYLNTIPLGESNYGIKAAAKDYFNKDLKDLTLRECAMLAGLAQSPYLYDPRRNTYTRNRMDITDKRTNTVLMRMYELGYIDKTQYDNALNEKVTIQKDAAQSQMYAMPYFVEYAISDVEQHMLKSRNLEDTAENRSRIDSELRTGGYKIYLTVDPQIQKTVENTLYTWKKYPKMQISRDNAMTVRDGDSGFTQIPQPQAAAVVLDYHTGQLKAIVGGRSQPKTKRTLNRASQSHMPVGSCIKPLAVYGPAIDKGLSPASIVYNVPAPINGWNTQQGYPSNYSGTSFTGPVSLRQGIINSYNVVAAHVLLDDVGLDDSVGYLQKLGIKSGINKDGPGLALGTSGITLVEMTGAYGAFGNKGEYIEPLSFTKVVDAKGATVLDADKVRTRTQVFKPSTAWMMINMMTDGVNKGTGTKAKIKNMTVAGKTGTNSDYRGVSFNALTPYYAAAVWVGSDAYKPLYKGATGGSDAAPLWQAFMSKIVTDKKQKNKAIIPDKPESLGLVKATVCGVSGKPATEACKTDAKYKTVTDWFLEGTVPSGPCNMHYQMKICKASGKVATQYCPVDQVEEGSVLLVPKDSIIRKMKPADVLKYFPNALLDFPGVDDLSEFTPDNPLYAQYFCPIHTEDWSQVQQQYNELAGLANALVKDVKGKMDGASLSQSVRDTLNAKIKTVNDILTKGFTDPAVPPMTVYNNLVAAYNDLKSYAELVLPEEQPTPGQPTPTPTAEPTATPGA